jgi:hypothetical protein
MRVLAPAPVPGPAESPGRFRSALSAQRPASGREQAEIACAWREWMEHSADASHGLVGCPPGFIDADSYMAQRDLFDAV